MINLINYFLEVFYKYLEIVALGIRNNIFRLAVFGKLGFGKAAFS